MDLKQRKLSKSEWDSIEIPVSKSENEILRLITNGFSNVQLKVNKTDSIFTYLTPLLVSLILSGPTPFHNFMMCSISVGLELSLIGAVRSTPVELYL